MQIAGRTCAISGQKIMLADQGIGCRSCDAAFLREHVQGTICPQCQQDMAGQEAAERLTRQEAVRGHHSRGRARFIFVGFTVIMRLLLEVAALIAVAKAGRLPGLFSLPSLFILVAFVWARFGNRGARLCLKLAMIVSLFFGTVTLLRTIELGEPMGMIFPAFVTAAFLLATCFLFTRSLNLYLDDQLQKVDG